MKQLHHKFLFIAFLPLVLGGCQNGAPSSVTGTDSAKTSAADSAGAAGQKKIQYISQPLVTQIYTADPSAHVFNGRIYIYPSHDTSTGTPEDDLGSHFDMRDYHILSMDSIGGKVTDHGVALDIRNIPWAGRQLWAPDAAFGNNTYYLYFPVKDKKDIFHIGVATSSKPEGPFTAEKEPIKGTYSIDPCVFKDDDGS
ncbi:MAG: family 43 glycosylhydrolase, partial [Chitinophaga rupis]